MAHRSCHNNDDLVLNDVTCFDCVCVSLLEKCRRGLLSNTIMELRVAGCELTEGCLGG